VRFGTSSGTALKHARPVKLLGAVYRTGEIEKYSESLSSPRRCVQTAKIFRSRFDHSKFQERASCRGRELVQIRRLLLFVVVLAGIAYVGRKYDPEIGGRLGSICAVSRVERPNTGVAPGRALEIHSHSR